MLVPAAVLSHWGGPWKRVSWEDIWPPPDGETYGTQQLVQVPPATETVTVGEQPHVLNAQVVMSADAFQAMMSAPVLAHLV